MKSFAISSNMNTVSISPPDPLPTSSAPPPQLRQTHAKTNPSCILLTFLLLSSIKYLLIPSYRSTDFDVHRNWLAITHHLPLREWYFEDVNGTTVHTLDYPPLFAFFEALLSNNVLTRRLLEKKWLDRRCLELLPDDQNQPSGRCVRFQRATVILSDGVLFLGAYLASQSIQSVEQTNGRPLLNSAATHSAWITFLLIVTNPGLILLDHVHFQYNGMLLGILLCSIAFIIQGSRKISTVRQQYVKAGDTGDSGGYMDVCSSSQLWELGGAATFASLLAMKHLYLTLAPLYLFYLLRHHCFVVSKRYTENYEDNGKKDAKNREQQKQSTAAMFSFKFSWSRFAILAMVTLCCFFGPFLPFAMQSNPMGQVKQILKRLFPFGRGVSLMKIISSFLSF